MRVGVVDKRVPGSCLARQLQDGRPVHGLSLRKCALGPENSGAALGSLDRLLGIRMQFFSIQPSCLIQRQLRLSTAACGGAYHACPASAVYWKSTRDTAYRLRPKTLVCASS